MLYVVQWWDVLFVKGMHFHQKRLLNLLCLGLASMAAGSTELGIAFPR